MSVCFLTACLWCNIQHLYNNPSLGNTHTTNKAYQSTSKHLLNKMQTPTKRSLSFGSPSSSRSPSESKKTTVVGYVLDTSVVMKGFYFYVQLQDSETNVVQIPVYNAKIHQTISNFEASGDPVKLEVYKQEDGKLKVGSYSHVYPASPRDITFSINSSLKETIQLEKASRKISVKDLRRIMRGSIRKSSLLKGELILPWYSLY